MVQIYDPNFVRQLFDEMSATYGIVNLISSFGFCRRWRRQCIEQLSYRESLTVVDLMTGMGELCPAIAKRIGPGGKIIAVDNSPVMCRKAWQNHDGRLGCELDIREEDALGSEIPDASADRVVCSFGLKTFSLDQTVALAHEVHRILKPGGSYSFIEISVPPARWLRVPYLFYLHQLIPIIGRILMGNPDNYRMLGVYTVAFGDCHTAVAAFRQAGLDPSRRSYFFGCATGLVGAKPQTPSNASQGW
ncbi:class I SAM-dependent methyltransferase [Rhodopirellula sp. JC639]|uniref:class I SAM-dependent methyltransferase n=1 Tax=Stieleria mannarensis TaxID=2755585 RepID=UPI0016002ABD|nr:class I SAM-dependent methyltransferase [Rhodopirellula sp. JC639]